MGKLQGKEYDKIIEELKAMDDIDIAIILALGSAKLKHTKIQKIAFILSKLLDLELDAVAYNYGSFSETIMEKLYSKYYSDWIVSEKGEYRLSEKGLKALHFLYERLEAVNKQDVIKLLEVLRSMSEENILALTYYLFPEYAVESRIKREVERTINRLKRRALKNIKIIEYGRDDVVVMIDAR